MKEMGLQPSTFRSSVESLVRRSLRNGKVPTTGLETIDLYNFASLRFVIPVGAVDLDKISEPITLRFARTSDTYEPLAGRSAEFPLHDRVLVYATGDTVLTYGLNCRESSSALLDAASRNAIYVAEAANRSQAADAQAALEWLADRLRKAGALVGKPGVVAGGWPTTERAVPWDEVIHSH